jgi:hypothetical protein
MHEIPMRYRVSLFLYVHFSNFLPSQACDKQDDGKKSRYGTDNGQEQSRFLRKEGTQYLIIANAAKRAGHG